MRKIHPCESPGKTRFAMAFHVFQPVFNLEGELEKAYTLAYEPFLRVMEKFPKIKGTFHFSGNMLEWFEKKKPDYIVTLRSMVKRGQIEIMGGGFFEPVMPIIPREDAAEQIRMLSRTVERIFGVTPKGVWTTERVWHRGLADLYQKEGIEYTILDDNHLLSSFSGERGRFSACTTYGDSGSVTVFPACTRLRYLMPFRPVEQTIDFMKNSRAHKSEKVPCFFFADDMEKFGAWPYTNAHVYKKKWLENFFRALIKEEDWLKTATYGEVSATSEKQDVGVLQPVSYQEMDSWSGGNFSNFMDKYPESGRMYKRMLEVSAKMSGKTATGMDFSAGKDHPGAKRELLKAQTSCPYWHGTFGGVYLPHLRSGVYSHIIRAEKMMDSPEGSGTHPVFCAERSDGKGTGESILGNSYFKIFIDPERGAAIEEIDLHDREINLVNSFSRRREKYHKKLEKGYGAVIKKARKDALTSGGENVDIHEILGVEGKGLGKILDYDVYRRTGFITRIVPEKVSWENFVASKIPVKPPFDGEYIANTTAKKDLITQVFSKRGILKQEGSEGIDIEVVKTITLGTAQAITVTQGIKGFSKEVKEVTGGVEFNFLIWDTPSMRSARTFVSDLVELEDRYTGLEVKFFMDRPMKVTSYPVYTINETERGLGKTFQGVCLVIGDNFILKEDSEEKIGITIYIR